MEKSKLYVRFSNSCTSNDMEFSLSGSTKAIKYAIPVWLNEEEEGYKLSKDELSRVREYYLKLSCEDLLDTVKPMYTDYMENTSVLFETQEGTNGILAGTLVQVKNSNKLNHKIKIWATRNSKTTEFHVTPEEAKKFINEHDVIEAMDKGLSDFWRRMDNCE
jgi:hypothetical protein